MNDEDREAITAMISGWNPYDPCPCGCGGIGFKLKRNGHTAVACKCRSCINRNNQSKGRKAQKTVHQALGGEGNSPKDEETGRPLPVWVMPEVKTGKQVPSLFDKFISTEWFRRALSQSERALPAGSGVKPSVSIVRGSDVWLLVKLK